MSGLFTLLQASVDGNARRAVDVYTEELPEFRVLAKDSTAQADMLDFAVLLRRREAELAADGRPFTDSDTAVLRAFGEKRGAAGVSLISQQRVLALHSVLTLREIQEAAGPDDSARLMHMLGWLPANGLVAQTAYTEGFLLGQKRFLPLVRRVQAFARMLIADNPAVDGASASLGMPLGRRYAVVAVRIPDPPFAAAEDRRDEIVEVVLSGHHVPVTWHEPGTFMAVVPSTETTLGEPDEPTQQRITGLVRDFAAALGRPCAAGAAMGGIGGLAETLALARRISEAAPVETAPERFHTLSDVLVELGVTQTPQVEQWLRQLGARLGAGPDLIRTLDAFYRHGMNRLNTAGALHIHPRTLDYRLHRVRELAGLEPGSVRGVRILTTTVTLALSGRWA
jgi:hypothetical protein